MPPVCLPATLAAWESPGFVHTLKQEIGALAPACLPLAQAATPGCYIGAQPVTVMFMEARDEGTTLRITLGVFFTEILVNCGCGADPVEQHAQCHMQLELDKHTAEARFHVVEA